MEKLRDVARKFNKEIVSWRPDCYAIVQPDGLYLAIWLDGTKVVEVDIFRKVSVLLEPGFKPYEVLKGCFPDKT